MAAKFKVSFELDEEDADYFRTLYRKAKREAKTHEPDKIIADAREIVSTVRKSKKTPKFVVDAIGTLADLTDLIQDADYSPPKKLQEEVLAAIAYFSNPDDLIPDSIPGLGFLDDAIMIKFVEEEFKHELWGYRKFCARRDSKVQRPWQQTGKDRLAADLADDRKRIRGDIMKRQAKEAERKRARGHAGW